MFSFLFKNSMSFDIDVESKIVFQKITGEVSSNDIIQINDQTIRDPRFDWGYHWVIDVRGSKQLFAYNRLGSFSSFYLKNAKLFKNVKMAIIIGSPKQYMTVDSLINLFEINHIDVSVKKVLDKELAYQWILGE